MENQIQTRKIIFTLNSKFYDKSAVEKSIADFGKVCDGKILNDAMDIELTLKKEIKEPLKEEFCNYVLGVMRNMD